MSAVVYLSPHRLAIIDIVEKTVVLLKTPDSASDANRIEKMHFVGQVERFDGMVLVIHDKLWDQKYWIFSSLEL